MRRRDDGLKLKQSSPLGPSDIHRTIQESSLPRVPPPRLPLLSCVTFDSYALYRNYCERLHTLSRLDKPVLLGECWLARVPARSCLPTPRSPPSLPPPPALSCPVAMTFPVPEAGFFFLPVTFF